jgi:hypothetical protein
MDGPKSNDLTIENLRATMEEMDKQRDDERMGIRATYMEMSPLGAAVLHGLWRMRRPWWEKAMSLFVPRWRYRARVAEVIARAEAEVAAIKPGGSWERSSFNTRRKIGWQ